MRCIPSAASVTISAISLYFALTWGADGLHVLADQLHGLDRPAHATVTFAIGWLLALDGVGIGHLTLTLGALKLAVAACFLVYLADRLSAVVTRDAVDTVFSTPRCSLQSS
jgi:hypothetical protein